METSYADTAGTGGGLPGAGGALGVNGGGGSSDILFPDYNGLSSSQWEEMLRQGEKTKSQRLLRPRFVPMREVRESALDLIGNTPMIRATRFAKAYGISCNLLFKCEYLSAGGSVKDRIGLRMVEEAEAEGLLKPGDTLIEPTSGNTGIGLSLAAALKGYKMVITLPEKMSQEKLNIMKLLGAEILRTPTEAAWNSPESHIGLALRLQQEIPNSHILDQYRNAGNPLAHYDGTAEEIWEQANGSVDVFIGTAGTGGTITGIGKKLKELNPSIKIVGVDPKGSILAQPENLNDEKKNMPYLVEGIGYDFIPGTLDRSVVDEWEKTDDAESFTMARACIAIEGLLVGGSSGSALAAALRQARTLTKDQTMVVLLPDSCRNYMTKFISDEWMMENGLLEETESPSATQSPAKAVARKQQSIPMSAFLANYTVADLKLKAPLTVSPDATCNDVIRLMDREGISQVPVVSDGDAGYLVGVITEGNLASYLANGRLRHSDSIRKSVYKRCAKVPLDCNLLKLSRRLELNPFALVVSTQKYLRGGDQIDIREVPVGIVTRIDLLRYYSEMAPLNQQQNN